MTFVQSILLCWMNVISHFYPTTRPSIFIILTRRHTEKDNTEIVSEIQCQWVCLVGRFSTSTFLTTFPMSILTEYNLFALKTSELSLKSYLSTYQDFWIDWFHFLVPNNTLVLFEIATFGIAIFHHQSLTFPDFFIIENIFKTQLVNKDPKFINNTRHALQDYKLQNSIKVCQCKFELLAKFQVYNPDIIVYWLLTLCIDINFSQ